MVRDCFVTEKILKELNLAELKLKTTMDTEEYNAYKLYFLEKDALRGASSSEFHSISSTSESPQNQEELKKWKQKTKIVETEKLKATSPLTVKPTTGHGKELIGKAQGRKGMLPLHGSYTSDPEEELEELRMKLQSMKGSSSPPLLSTIDLEEKLRRVCVNLKMLRVEGGFPVLQFSTIDLEKKLDELCIKFQRLRMKGTLPSPGLLTADLEEELKGLRTELNRLRMKGSSHPLVSTTEVQLDELLKQLQKWKKEGTSPPPIVVPTTGMLPLTGFSTFDLEEKLGELCEEIRIMEGSLHSLQSLHSLPTTSLKEKLKQVFGKSRMPRTKKLEPVFEGFGMPRMKGSFPVLDLEKKLAELRMELQRLRMEGTLPPPELFTADLEDELEQLEQRKEGSSHSLFPTIDTVFRLRKGLEKVKMEALENAMYPTIRSGLAKFDVSLPEELQNYVSYLLNESSKLHFRKQVLQSPRALEELRVAMDKDELKAFLTIHIREGAWQVVLLFTDELSISKQPWYCFRVIYNEDEDEDEDEEVSNEVIYSSISGILYGWPTEYDPDLITLCKAITNRDWKVTRLILSRSQISDEGLKNLSTALPQSELYSLTLYGNGLQNQGLKHLCEALIISDCHLTSLNVSHNMLGDEGIMHLRDALASVNCRLTTLNVSRNRLGDEGIVLLSNALTSVNCHLTSLNVSHNMLEDEGIMHLRDALASVNCRLTTLNVSHNKLGDVGIVLLSNALTSVNCGLTTLNVRENSWGDEGIVYLGNALTSIDCTLTSLNVSNNWLGDEGIVHLCNALTSVNCTLTSLNVSNNWLRDEGIMHLCNALTSVNCTLTSLNVSNNWLGDEGIMHLCNALTSVSCRLTSLNASHIRWEDNGFKHLCDALTSSNCLLTKLKIGLIRLGDGGIKELSEVLTNGFCTLTSLDISNNEFGDEGIKHLCKALTDTKCKLRSLDYHGNRYVTDKGRKYLSQMLTGTDWEVRGAQLSRSTTK